MFKTDRNNSNQHIWNSGEGAGSNDDNIYLRTDSAGNLYFGWGRGSNNNECAIGSVTSTGWNGVYIAFKGGRLQIAAGEADGFEELLNAYEKSKDITRTRLYLDALNEILPKVKKYIISD